MTSISKRTLLGAAMVTALGAGVTVPGESRAADTIKIGGLATLEGPFTVLGEDGMRGAQTGPEGIQRHRWRARRSS